jgi:adenylylsulfate kinase
MLLNVIVGSLGYFYLDRVERNYAKVLTQGLPLLNDLQTATAEASRSYGSAIELAQASDPAGRSKAMREIQSHLSVGDQIFASHNLRWFTPDAIRPKFDGLVALRQEWKRRILGYVAAVENGQPASSNILLSQLQADVYPSFRAYLSGLDRFCDDYQAESEKEFRALSRSNGDLRSLLIRFAGFSLLLISAAACVLAFVTLLNGKRSQLAPPPSGSTEDKPAPTPNRWIFPDLLRGVGRPQKQATLRQKSKVIWLYGLSGAGKTAIAEALERRLFAAGYFACMLDGDSVRSGLSRDLGFSDEARSEHIRRVAEVAKLNVQEGLICIVAVITPRRSFRKLARSIIGKDDFLEVFVSASLATCAKRDPKGLYSLNKAGQLQSLTGVDSVFEMPDAADGATVIDTEIASVDQCAARLFNEVAAACRL